MAEIQSPLMTLREAAAYLRKSTTWVYRHADEIGCIRDGGPLRFRRERLDAWISRHETRPPSLVAVPTRAPRPRRRLTDPSEINLLSGQRAGTVEALR